MAKDKEETESKSWSEEKKMRGKNPVSVGGAEVVGGEENVGGEAVTSLHHEAALSPFTPRD